MIIARIVAVAALAATSFLVAQEKDVPAGAVDAAAKTTTRAGAIAVGTVDLVRAFEQYPRWIQLKNDLENRAKAAQAKMAEMAKSIDEQRAAIAVLGQESEERRDREFDLQMMQQQRQEMGKRLKEKFELEEARALSIVYEDLEVAIKKVAQARGIQLVLRVHDLGPALGDPSKLSPATVNGRVTGFERRMVWFAADEIDLTPDLIKVLMVPVESSKPGDKPTAPADKGKAPAAGAGKVGG